MAERLSLRKRFASLVFVGAISITGCTTTTNAARATVDRCESSSSSFYGKGKGDGIKSVDEELKQVQRDVQALHTRTERANGSIKLDSNDITSTSNTFTISANTGFGFSSELKFTRRDNAQDFSVSIGAIACMEKNVMYPNKANVLLHNDVAITDNFDSTSK